MGWIAQLLLLCTCVGWRILSLHFRWLDGHIGFYGLDSPVAFFPRASERRVLLIVGSVIGVCHTSSHLHILLSSHLTSSHSHLHIFTSSLSLSHTHIFTSSHLHSHLHTHTLTSSLTSSHLHILTSSLSLSRTHIFTYSHLLSLSPLSSLLSLSPFSLPFLSLAFFIFLSLGRGWCRRGVTKRQPFRTK